MTEIEESKLVLKYEPLVNKLVKQFYDQVQCPWNDLKSMAYEGLAIAIHKYDSNRSKMSFTQYAAFAIRNNILTCLDEELRTVRLSAYAQKKVIERGGTTFNTISIDQPYHGDDERTPRESVMNMYEDEKFSNGDVFNYLYDRLDDKFSERDCNIFYMTFGLKGYSETKGRDIAKSLNISEGLVSQRLKKVITFIRQDSDLCEMLGSLI